MNRWVLLTGAIIAEVTGTVALRAATDRPLWIVLVVVAYLTAFILLGLTLRTGMKIGVVYGIWGAAGVALVAVFGMAIFGEALSTGDAIGITAIIAGVVLVESGSHSPGTHSPGQDQAEVLRT